MSRRVAADVWIIGDPGAPPRGSSDPDILAWRQAHDFVLVTEDRRSMPRHLAAHVAQGRHVPGVVALHGDMAVRRVLEELTVVLGASLPQELRDRIRYLPLSVGG